MFFYCKKIIYLSLTDKNGKKKLAGFARFAEDGGSLYLEIHLKNISEIPDGKYQVCFASRAGEEEIVSGLLLNGRMDAQKQISKKKDAVCLEEKEMRWEEIRGIRIPVDGEREICGYWRTEESEAARGQKPPEESEAARGQKTPEESEAAGEQKESAELEAAGEQKETAGQKADGEREKAVSLEARAGTVTETVRVLRYEEETYIAPEPESVPIQQPALDDKWKQLLRSYKQVHPFGDERVFIAIEPKDFIVLQAPYQRLVNNSFLLHGFYNYRHVILGEDREMGGGEGKCFYLGVPGTYFEREKKVAVMFGFEGFESDGAIEIGKFGYYLRHVEI